jgi:hypothetical protein
MSTSSTPLFGRSWKLSVKSAGANGPSTEILSQSSWDPEALRITFDVLQSSYASPYWFADVKVYNLNAADSQNLLWNAAWLTLEAGYQTDPGKRTIIWDGPIMQVLFDRENVVDLVMQFNCIGTVALISNNFVNMAFGPMSSQYDAVSNYINLAQGNPAQQVGPQAKQMMKAKQYPRGKTVFGDIRKYMGHLAEDNNLGFWNDTNLPNISEIYSSSNPNPVTLVYSPPIPPGYKKSSGNLTESIIGVPKQSQFGCIFTVLLDPRLKVSVPPMLAKLDMTIISQLKALPPNVIAPLDKGGVFVVGQVRHRGDTRGNDWYTEVTGYTQQWAQGLLKQLFSAAAPGATAAP